MSTKRDEDAVAIDYETFYDSRQKYSLTSMGTLQYCTDSRFDAYLVAICGRNVLGPWDGTENEDHGKSMFRVLPDGRGLYVGRPENYPYWKDLDGRILLAHNASFDSVVTSVLMRNGTIPRLNDVEWQCTADLTSFLLAPRNLKGAMKELFGKDISKAVRAAMDGKHDYDLSAGEYRSLVEYGGSDAVECHDIWNRYAAQWPAIERAISCQNRAAIAEGVLIDREYAESALKELRSYQARVLCEIPWTSQINPKTHEFYKAGSLPALRQAVIDLGIEPPKSFKKDDPGFLDWLESHKDSVPFIRPRQIAVALAMHIARIEGILSSLDEQGKAHPSFLYFGAHTGRFSGKSDASGVNINMLNMPRKPVFSGDRNVFDGKGVDIRGMYIPRPGYRFAVYDYSQIEARFALWLVGDTHMMAALKTEGNLYQANAVAMGWCQSKADIKHNEPDKYRLAKCCVLGLGYGMGAVKFVDSCKSQGLELPVIPVDKWPDLDRRLMYIIRNVAHIKGDPYSKENRTTVGRLIYSLRTVTDWRMANQKIVDRWRFYESVFKSRVFAGKNTVAFRLPSGRTKRYFDIHFAKEETIEVDENGREHPSERIAMKASYTMGGPGVFLTGGSLMENIVQASCRDIMTYGCVEISEKHPNWIFKFSVYDEVIFEVPEDECELASREIPRIMTKGDRIREWTEGMPLEVDGAIVERYCK